MKQALQAVVEKSLGREAAAEARRRPERTGVADLQLCSSMVPNENGPGFLQLNIQLQQSEAFDFESQKANSNAVSD